VAGALADGRVARRRIAGGRDPCLAGARLQPSGSSASPRGTPCCRGWPDDLAELPGVGPYTAAAIGNFAFGRPFLPVDVNVDRVLSRTGGQFGPDAAQALFDLGATICLARVPRCGACPLADDCPSAGRRYEPERKQSPFAGSFRQRRARVLRLVAAGPRAVELDPEALESLVADGLVVVDDGLATLPS
jgi:A/G-specific adenine glycosylase